MNGLVSAAFQVVGKGQDAPTPLIVTFFAPIERGGAFDARALVKCNHFERMLTLRGSDGMQAFFNLPMAVHAFLQGLCDREGYRVWRREPGDLLRDDIWGVKRLTTYDPAILPLLDIDS